MKIGDDEHNQIGQIEVWIVQMTRGNSQQGRKTGVTQSGLETFVQKQRGRFKKGNSENLVNMWIMCTNARDLTL